MMSECDPNETEGEPVVITLDITPSVAVFEQNLSSLQPPSVLFDKNQDGLGTNPGIAVRISGSMESVLTELETDGSGEETLLLPCLTGSTSSPRGAREKRSRRNRHSSSSDKDNLASPGKPVT